MSLALAFPAARIMSDFSQLAMCLRFGSCDTVELRNGVGVEVEFGPAEQGVGDGLAGLAGSLQPRNGLGRPEIAGLLDGRQHAGCVVSRIAEKQADQAARLAVGLARERPQIRQPGSEKLGSDIVRRLVRRL